MSGDRLMTDAEAMLLEGYAIGKKIGQGSFGKVYETVYTDSETGRRARLACKIVRLGVNNLLDKCTPRELAALAGVDHPGVVRLHSALRRGPTFFLLTGLADNGDLRSFLGARGAAAEPTAKEWLRQMADALRYLHGLGIAHRDLKTDNVLLTTFFDAVLADLGSARRCREDDRRLLSTTFGCGTIAYQAPEVISETPYDPVASDVWSLGVVLFATLYAQLPFDDSHPPRMLAAQLARRLSSRTYLGKDVSHEAQALVARILEPDLAKRPGLDSILDDPWLSN